MRGVLIAARGFFNATRSNCDAARHVVFWSSRLVPMGPPGLYHDAACRIVFWPSQREDSPARHHKRKMDGLCNDAARRVATFFDKSDCMIETSLPARRGRHR